MSLLLTVWACNGSKKLVGEQPNPDKAKEVLSGIVYYDIKVETAAGMPQPGIGDQAKLYFNHQWARQEQIGTAMDQGFMMTDLSNGQSTSYVELMNKKFAIAMTGPMIPELTDIRYTDEEKTIAGYLCKKAIGTMNDQEATIYFTQSIKANYCPYANQSAGFALAYTLPMPYGKLSYTANKVMTEAPPAEKLQAPEGYKSVTPMQLQKELMSTPPSFNLEEIPDFTLSDLNGNQVQLTSLKGKVVVLNFWFIACKPCQMEMPDLNELKATYDDNEVAFLGITFDSRSDVQDFLGTTDFHFTILPEANNTIRDYGVMAFPTTIVLDKKGALVDSVMGGSMNIKEIIQQMIETGLNSD